MPKPVDLIVFLTSAPQQEDTQFMMPLHKQSIEGRLFHDWLDRIDLPTPNYCFHSVSAVKERRKLGPADYKPALKPLLYALIEHYNVKFVAIHTYPSNYLLSLGIEHFTFSHPLTLESGGYVADSKKLDFCLKQMEDWMRR